MAIDPKLLVIKPVNQLQNEPNPLNAKVLMWNGGNELKTTPLDGLRDLVSAGVKGILKISDPKPAVGAVGKYDLSEVGTYTNLVPIIAVGSSTPSNTPITTQSNYINSVFWDGVNFTQLRSALPQATQNLPHFEDLSFPVTSTAPNYVQCVYNDVAYELKNGQTANVGDVPGVSNKWVHLVKDLIQNITEVNNTYNVDPSQIVPTEALYNDQNETIAVDILKRVDKNTGENVNYREVTLWHDGSQMNDTKVDGVIYIKKNNKYYVLTKFILNGSVDVRLFGETNTITNTTATFKRALKFLHDINGGVLNVPLGTFTLNETLTISEPNIGIKGVGIEASRLQFEGCNGLVLSSYVDFSFAVISDISIFGNDTSGTIGISLPNSNFYFLEKFLIANFDIGIKATTAVMSKFTDFSIISCNGGILFESGCYFVTVFNGNVRGCINYGINDSGNGIKILFTDVEAIGTYNTVSGHYENGSAIKTSHGTTISNCHIETSGVGIEIDTGGCKVENTFIGGCVIGVKEKTANANNNFYSFEKITFYSNFDAHFDIPTTTYYEIKNCNYYTATGGGATPIILSNSNLGYIEQVEWSPTGMTKKYSIKDIKINEDLVMKGSFVVLSNDFGTIAQNSSVQFHITLPNVTGSEYSTNVLANFQTFTIPNGIFLFANWKPSTINVVVLNVANISTDPIDLGIKTIIIKTFK